MKILAHLERNKSFWSIFLIGLLFFLLRLPSLIEPNWYGDEGIYQVIGQALHNHHLLYRDIWDNKPPLLYIIYALASGDQTITRVASLVAGLASLIIFFILSNKLFQSLRISIIISLLYTFLFGTPIMEGNIANAENFILLPVLTAGLLIYIFATNQEKQAPQQKKLTLLYSCGLLLGVGFLLKIVAVFDFSAFFLFLFTVNTKKINLHQLTENIKQLRPLLIGFVIPIAVTFVYFFVNNGMKDFIDSVFFGNVDYVGWKNSFLGIPQGLLLLKLVILLQLVIVFFMKRHLFNIQSLFVLTWVTFTTFSALFSGRPYTHYLLVLLPAYCLLVGIMLANKNKLWKNVYIYCIIILTYIIFANFQLYSFTKSILYYQNAALFLNGKKDIKDYQSFFDNNVPRDYALAAFINTHTTPTDNVFLWGNNPQIYALTHKLPPGKYIVAYHITHNDVALNETQSDLDKSHPKYIIALKETGPLPFHIPLYIMRFSLPGATIYERNL